MIKIANKSPVINIEIISFGMYVDVINKLDFIFIYSFAISKKSSIPTFFLTMFKVMKIVYFGNFIYSYLFDFLSFS